MFSSVGSVLQRDPVDDLEPVALDPAVLRRVVRHEPHRRDAEVDEDLRTDPVLPRVGWEARDRCWPRRCRDLRPATSRRGACGPSPMPRPSWPRRYTTTPWPSAAMRSSARSSCVPQSQRIEPNTSPVRHSECTRTSTFSLPATSPRTNAMCSVPSSSDSNTCAAKSPCLVGMRASETRRTSFSRCRRYRIRSAMVTSASPCSAANASRSGMRCIVPSSFTISASTPAG